MAHAVLFLGALFVALADNSWHGLIVFGLMLVILIDTFEEAIKIEKRSKDSQRVKDSSDAG